MTSHLDGIYLDSIDTGMVEKLIQAKLKEAGTSRVNRMNALLSSILSKAFREWGWLDNVPHIRKFKESAGRIRWLTREEADRLLKALPDHTRDMAAFTLATGLREANVCFLEWSQINMQNKLMWVHADESKNNKMIRVPLNEDAIAILRNQIGKHPKRVFTYKGKPIAKAGTENWRNIVRSLGIENFCWHGLRHTWASWHVQAGTPLHVLQELGGWSCYEMVLRYAHLAPEHLSADAASISGMLNIGKEKENIHRISQIR